MANSSRTRSSGSSSRGSKTGSAKKPARNTSSRSSARRTVQPAPEGSRFTALIGKFAASKAAMPLIFIAAVILLTGIDLLVSWNNYGLFFKILGVEILIAVFVWVILTLVFSRKNTKDPDSSLEDEV